MQKPQDAVNSIFDKAPKSWQPYLQLSRFDRPIGFWLLGIPCFMGQFLGRINEGFSLYDFFLGIFWVIGAIAMRGAGCTINDIADKDFDAQVERTKMRPLACGAISTKQAYMWLAAQLFIGFLVLLFLPDYAKIIALLAVPMVVAYPFMKRITWWPQAWLGMTFNWGILVGYAAVSSQITLGALIFWAGAILWTLGYDTIYAMSDIKDDALIGVKSTARKFGDDTPKWVKNFYFGTFSLFMLAIIIEAKPFYAAFAAIPFMWFFVKGLHSQYQALIDGEKDFTKLFRQNKKDGLFVIAALICVVLFSWLLRS